MRKIHRRRASIAAATFAVLLTTLVAAGAPATTTTIRAGNLRLTVFAAPSPRALPRNELTPFSLKASAKIKTADGTHPPALREVRLSDKNVAIDAQGVPVCRRGQLEARTSKDAKRVCGKALVGDGTAHALISFPEQTPIRVASPLLVFNGGTRAGKTRLYIHAYITVPVPSAIVTAVVIERIPNGLKAVARIPVIAGGSGSALDFRFRIGRSDYLRARCPTGSFPARLERAVFRNEAGVEGVPAETVVSGRLSVPCTPKR